MVAACYLGKCGAVARVASLRFCRSVLFVAVLYGLIRFRGPEYNICT